MKAHELRIGNYVWDKNHNELSDVVHLEQDYVNRVQLSDGESDYEYCNVSPIPLSEEWLIKLGFKRIDDPRQTRIWWRHQTNLRMEEIQEVRLNEYFCYRPITTVHQLQNLYFALTGEELTIK